MEHKTRKGFFKQQFPPLKKLLKYTVIHSSQSIEQDKVRRYSLSQDFRYLEELLKKAVIHPSQFVEYNQLAAFNISLTDFPWSQTTQPLNLSFSSLFRRI